MLGYLHVLKNYISELQREKDYTLAEHYINEGINKSITLGQNDANYYKSFVFSSGINYYFKKEYNRALDSINKAESKLGINSLSLAYYLKGKIYKTQDTVKAIKYFNKVDSIFQINHTNIYGLFNNYKSLITIHRANNNYTQQIENIDKLIVADSIVNANKIYYEEKILNEYEIPKYKFEKEKIINNLKEKSENRTQVALYLYTIIALAFLTAFYFFRKQIVYKKRFNQLVLDTKITKTPIVTKEEVTNKLDISEENIANIIVSLGVFETELGFLDNNINLTKLSKKIGTNSSYLSKVINKIKKKSFSQYLNDLRIDYIIKELKNNSLLRKHTIYAIAQEIGFNNSESFSKAFYKKAGIYPSYFIRQLEKDVT
ncbi:helix-turn-helix domain-containing protein [Lacinutrix sp.]|uniref:helix-turn-helix domain-containing protein n=1 Tax=Lacinutrix sp. TaxID=1937692 RepID=UPI0025C03314|nr:helix-turn-helix domain-containing protein [Lacinutrix sp.]